MLRISYAFFRVLGRTLLAIYFLLALAFLGLRYAVLPNIDIWRDQIAGQLSGVLDTQVRLGKVDAQWNGLHPRIALTDVSLVDKQGRQVLHLPEVQAVLSWRSLLDLEPNFARLEISGLDLSMRRDRAQHLWIMGHSYRLDDTAASPEIDDKTIQWLLSNRHISLHDSTLRWSDEWRSAPELTLREVDLLLQNGGGRHTLSLEADLPTALGAKVRLAGDFHFGPAAKDGQLAWNQLDGDLYVDFQDMRPLGWQPWVDQPQDLRSGDVSARASLSVSNGSPDTLVWDARIGNGHWVLNEGTQVMADFAHFYLKGPWTAYRQVFDRQLLTSSPETIEMRIQARNLSGDAHELFERNLNFDRVNYQGSVQRGVDSRLNVQATTLELDNADLQIAAQAVWKQGPKGAAGSLELDGRLPRGKINAIVDYLPLTVDEDARIWMKEGLLAGQLHNANFSVTGELDYFPFGLAPDKGDFIVEGEFQEGVIDYVPESNNQLGWPRLEALAGSVRMHRADLKVQARQGLMRPTADSAIDFKNLNAHIPNIEKESILTVSGESQASGQTYLALSAHSPLGGLLDGTLDGVASTGTWHVPLSLTVPLLNTDDTTVQGEIHFQGGNLNLDPGMPPFERVQGKLLFTESDVKAEQLQAQFLGGGVKITGGMGGSLSGLTLRGEATSAALTDYVSLAGMKRLQGRAPYVATLQGKFDEPLSIALSTTLRGMAVDLPPPFQKDASQTMTLKATWRRHEEQNDLMLLGVTLGDAQASFLHKARSKSSSFFHAGMIALGQTPALPEKGLAIDIRYPDIDADSWNEVVDEFSQPLQADAAPSMRSILPGIHQIRLQADQARIYGVAFDKLTYTASQPEAHQWRVDISSSQTAGTLFWREAQGRIAGQVDAKFDRLDLGRDKKLIDSPGNKPATEIEPAFADDFDIPAINLYVKHFRLYGRHVGELSLVGISQEPGTSWRLEQVKLSSPHAELTGSGSWRLKGADRGLSVDASVKAEDMGAYLAQLGFENLMQGGRGALHGNFHWRNLPWDYSKSDLSGNLIVELDKGRFSSLDSRSARLLELLSLQSIRRLATLNLNMQGLTKEGFPFDTLRGDLVIDKGLFSTQGYRVSGPVGTIVIDGKANWLEETLDLRAAVAPHLDVSGAAIAAGIALNPIVGVGAFLAQWVLQMSLRNVMAIEYHIHGTWDEPVLDEVGTKPENESIGYKEQVVEVEP